MSLQLFAQVADKRCLSCGANRPFGREVVVYALANSRLPLVVVGGLDDLNGLVGEIVLQHLQRRGQHAEPVMPEGVIRQPDDVVVNRCEAGVEVFEHVALARTLGMDDNLCIRTNLAAGCRSVAQEVPEPLPVLFGRGGETTIRRRTSIYICAPQHAVRYLVTNLDEVGCRIGGYQCFQTLLGVSIDSIRQLLIVQRSPACGNPLVGRVCPGVGVVKIEHQSHSFGFDTLAEWQHVG